MSAQSFFEAFTQLIQPDCGRSKELGDFYNSPLRHLGIEQNDAYQVSPDIMQVTSFSDHRTVVQTTLEEMQYFYEQDDKRFLSFMENVAAIFLSEACLRVFPHDKAEFHDFFKGIDLLSGNLKNSDNESDIGDKHGAENKTYSWLLHAALAVIWARYKQLQLDSNFPSKSLITQDAFKSCSIDKEDLLNTYCELYSFHLKNIPKFLDVNLDCYLSPSPFGKFLSFRSSSSLKKKLPSSTKKIDLEFAEKPWKNFFHKLKKGNNLNFKNPGNYFSFYREHPSYIPLWNTLLLLDLHAYLENHLNGRPWIEPQDGFIEVAMKKNDGNDYLKKLTIDDEVDAQPRMAKVLHDRLVERSGEYSQRLTRRQLSKPEQTIVDDENSLNISSWTEPLNASPFATWNITLNIAEAILEKHAGLSMLLHIDAFYFHDNKRTLIPCELLSEQEVEKDGKVQVYFEIGLDRVVIDALGFDPSEVPWKAGFTGIDGEGWLIIVFARA